MTCRPNLLFGVSILIGFVQLSTDNQTVMKDNNSSPKYLPEIDTLLVLSPVFAISKEESNENKGFLSYFAFWHHSNMDTDSFTNRNGMNRIFDKTRGVINLTSAVFPKYFHAIESGIAYINVTTSGTVCKEQREFNIRPRTVIGRPI